MRVILLVVSLIGLHGYLLVDPLLGADTEYVYVGFDQSRLGAMLRAAVDSKGSEAVADIFANVPRDVKKRVYEALDKGTRVTTVERLTKGRSGEWELDAKWEPQVVLDGRTGGILLAKEIGVENDSLFGVSVEVIRSRVDPSNANRRTGVLQVKMRLVGEDLNIKYPEQHNNSFQWQIAFESLFDGKYPTQK